MRSQCIIIILLLFLAPACMEKEERPNFLFILVDDLGYMDVGFNNPATFYETPSIDSLASRGTIFLNAYAACPVCSPTRASILTGKYPARLGTTDYFGAPQPEEWSRNTPLLPASYSEKLDLNEVTIAEILKAEGYRTFFAGKWHLGEEGYWPEDQGFDINRGGITLGGPYGGNKYFSPYENPRLDDGPEGEHLPGRLADETIKFIKESGDTPFFAYLSFYSVHTPLMAPGELVDKYRTKSASADLDSWGSEPPSKVRLVQNHPVYAGMVEAMDKATGRVLSYLDSSGLGDNTVVFFFSDNGGLSTSEGHPTSNMPLRAGKGWLYEGGIREPMIIRWPGHGNEGAKTSIPVISTDFFPTILSMAGIKKERVPSTDGSDLTGIIKGEKSLPQRYLYWHYPHYSNQGGGPSSAVSDGRYKLIRFYEPRPPEMYDIVADPGESRNLRAEMPEKADTLDALLRSWLDETGALYPRPNPAYQKR